MIEKKIEVSNKLGLHLRAAAQLVQTATRYRSKVWLFKDKKKANAKSIMGVMAMEAGLGDPLLLRCQGPDEAEAAAVLAKLFEDKFGEDGAR